METNTLVRHKKLKSIGIGCVARVKSKTVLVNFGKEDVMECKPTLLNPIDTSKCRTIPFSEFRAKSINNSFKEKKGSRTRYIVGNELQEYVGIGWVTIRIVTEDDLTKYTRVI